MVTRHKSSVLYLVIVACIVAPGCARIYAPSGWLPAPRDVPRNVYGGWVRVEFEMLGDSTRATEGELIATDDQGGVVILTTDGAVRVKHDSIAKAVVDIYRKETILYAGWTALGTLSTASHGAGLIFSAPIWLITGITSTANISHGGYYRTESTSHDWWGEMPRYSRFPQGLPKSLDLTKLIAKH